MITNTKIKKVNSFRLSQARLRNKALTKGVNLIAPETIFLSKDTKFGKNITIEPYVVIGSKVIIGNNVVLKSFSHIEGAKIKNNVSVGPFARVRPGTKLESGTRIGNFVETKNSKIDSNSKVSHLSYIGDAKVGKNSNIGAGTITCNYDGFKKNKTKIKNNVFIGSNTSIVAPVTINEKSVVGAGSVITKNVNIGAGTITCNYDGVKKNKTKIKDNVFIGSNTSLVAPITINEKSIVGAGSVITKSVRKKSLALTRSPQIEINNYKRKK